METNKIKYCIVSAEFSFLIFFLCYICWEDLSLEEFLCPTLRIIDADNNDIFTHWLQVSLLYSVWRTLSRLKLKLAETETLNTLCQFYFLLNPLTFWSGHRCIAGVAPGHHDIMVIKSSRTWIMHLQGRTRIGLFSCVKVGASVYCIH